MAAVTITCMSVLYWSLLPSGSVTLFGGTGYLHVHAEILQPDPGTKEELYNALRYSLEKMDINDNFIVAGHLNARVDEDMKSAIVMIMKVTTELCTEHGLTITNRKTGTRRLVDIKASICWTTFSYVKGYQRYVK